MADAVPEWLCWAQNIKLEHEKLANQTQHDTDANAANARLLERDLRDLSASHNRLYEDLNSLKTSLPSLSESITRLERSCEIRFQRHDRRLSTLESEQSKLLNAIDRIVQVEEAFERHRHEDAQWKEQWDQAAARANERHRQEIYRLRKQMEISNPTAPSQNLSDPPQPSGKIASSAELARRAFDARPSDLVVDAHSQASTTDDEEASVARYSPEQEDTRPPRKRPRNTPLLAREGANHSMLLSTSPSRSSEFSVTTASGGSRSTEQLRKRAMSNSSEMLASLNHRSSSRQNHGSPTASNEKSNRQVPTTRGFSNSSIQVDENMTLLENDASRKTGLGTQKILGHPRELTTAMDSDLQQLMALRPQTYYNLEEYLILGEEVIVPSMQTFERKLIQKFVNGMEDERQRCSLITKLDQNGWTWKVTQQELIAISDAARKQAAEEASTRKAIKNTKHEKQRSLRTEPTRSSQRNKRKINYRL